MFISVTILAIGCLVTGYFAGRLHESFSGETFYSEKDNF